nr:MAG TPA_asm: protein of unknown function (DUF3439) [Caudoviricetes sp.]DAV88545.1 MAG TPA: protein of unknown function (DUF3439) [Caudoviricetes sp.]
MAAAFLFLQKYVIRFKIPNCQLFMPWCAYFCRVMTS